jgi:two-component system, LytTR family, sensor kinase
MDGHRAGCCDMLRSNQSFLTLISWLLNSQEVMIGRSFPSIHLKKSQLITLREHCMLITVKFDRMQLPQYNGKDNLVMALTVPLLSLLFNAALLRGAYFSHWTVFLSTSLLTMGVMTAYFVLCGGVAVIFKKRLPKDANIRMRLTLTILTILLMSGLTLYALFLVMETIPELAFHFSERSFLWSYFALGVINIFMVFLMEGIAKYQEWERSSKDTEQLQQAIKKSQLNSLKSQVNPHFLFNSLNSLSSLIQEDEYKAEKFLNEMSKVYRYMLHDGSQWVTLETELSFLSSYYHLLKARFGEGLQIETNIPEAYLQCGIAPLTLQIIVENAYFQNVVSKSKPLRIQFNVNEDGDLIARNNLQIKNQTNAQDLEASLDQLVEKYKLLGCPIQVVDKTEENLREIVISLISIYEKA